MTIFMSPLPLTSFTAGLVQKIIPLPYDSALKYTIAKYYTPSGRCIQVDQLLGYPRS